MQHSNQIVVIIAIEREPTAIQSIHIFTAICLSLRAVSKKSTINGYFNLCYFARWDQLAFEYWFYFFRFNSILLELDIEIISHLDKSVTIGSQGYISKVFIVLNEANIVSFVV